MHYGHFDDTAREYVVERPDTPFPWINYLGSVDFFSLISNQGGGYSFYRDARLRRLTRFRYNSMPADSGGGRYPFVNDGGDVWSPTYQPVAAELDRYDCRHGLGYSRITGTRRGVDVSTLCFVPVSLNAEVQLVTVTNQSAATKTIELFSYVEFCLWEAWDDQTNFQRNLSIGEVEVDGSTIYHLTEYRERRNHLAVFSVNAPISGFDTDRETFVGRHRSLDEAEVPGRGRAGNSVASGWAPIGSHQVSMTLAAGESRQLVFVLGYVENPADDKWEQPGVVRKDAARQLLAQLATAEQVEAEFSRLQAYWDSLLGAYQVSSSDQRLNRSVNLWNPYQCMVTFNMSRSASSFESGIGRSLGFRDSNQDLLGFVHMVPQRARQRLLDIAAIQFADGSAYHQYQPLTKRGNDQLGAGFNDDPLWLVVAAVAYIKETGDWAVLDEPVTFVDGATGDQATLLDHLRASIGHVTNHLGQHGLPLIGRADWNDCLNLNCFSTTPGESFQTVENKSGGVAESLMIAGLFTYVTPEYARLLDHLGLVDEAVAARAADTAMRQAILDHGWDGAWFLRAYDYYGNPVGTSAHDEARIFIESQGMCVMGGNGFDDGRAGAALDSVERELASEHGIALLAPAFTTYHPEYGEISSYPPGYKENGSVFCHNNPWIIIAETMVGSRQRAFDYFRRINPVYREDMADLHRLEPYAYAQTIAGPQANRFGEAKNSWLTGTAAWAYVAASQHILGVRPDFDGLIIDPAVPADFGSYQVKRQYRGATYIIDITLVPARAPGPTGAPDPTEVPDLALPPGQLTIDGQPIRGNRVPVAPPGTTVHVTWTPPPNHQPGA